MITRKKTMNRRKRSTFNAQSEIANGHSAMGQVHGEVPRVEGGTRICTMNPREFDYEREHEHETGPRWCRRGG